jgi:uncharacterized membrane protein YeaQ/YmgE (transglycosylase-associated protein family)
MSLLQFLCIGLVAGWIMGRITRGRGFGFLGNLIVGAMGSLVGGFVFGFLGLSATNSVGSLVMAVVGAIVFFLLLSFLRPNRHKKLKKESDE